MKRFCAVLLAAAALVGCRNSQPATNPFLRTTVPPPGTGEGAVVVPGEPYYPGAAPGPAPAAAPVIAPPGAVMAPAPVAPQPVVAPPRDLKTSPPGGSYQYHQSSTSPRNRIDAGEGGEAGDAPASERDAAGLAIGEAPPGALRLAGPSDALREAMALAQDPKGVVSANFEEFAGELPGESGELGEEANPDEPSEPAPARAEVAQAATSTIRMVAEDSVAESTELTREASDSPSSARAVMRVTADAPETADDAERRKPAAVASAVGQNGAYAFAPDYTSLSGRLEYSHSLRQWKLRYIPIDGQTDSYGGSVVLGDSADLAAFKPGDQVSVRGSLAGGPSAGGSFSPRYRLDRVERLAP